jgi:hypothetical protein
MIGRRRMMGSHKPRISAQQSTDPRIESRLDQELEQTFPASDALQITRDPPPHPANHRRQRPPAVRGKAHKAPL